MTCVPGNTVILVPCYKYLEPETEQALVELKRRGWTLEVRYGFAAIDAARSIMASWALHQGFENLFWIDSDIGFTWRDFQSVAQSPERFCCGPYMVKQMQGSIGVLPREGEVIDCTTRGVRQIRGAGFGFMKTHKSIYEAMTKGLPRTDDNGTTVLDGFKVEPVPTCHEFRDQPPFWPFFQPRVFEINGFNRYYGEDYSFCLLAEKLGFKLFANFDTDLVHIGRYGFRWRQDSARAGIQERVKVESTGKS